VRTWGGQIVFGPNTTGTGTVYFACSG